MKRLIWAALAAVLALASCQPDSKPQDEKDPVKTKISAKVAEVTMFSVAVDVTVDENTTFYATLIKDADYKGVTPEGIAAELAAKVASGSESWGNLLKINSQKVEFKDLEMGEKYQFIAFCINATAEITSEEPAILSVETENFTVQFTVEDLEMFGYNMKIDVNNQDVYYFATSLYPYEIENKETAVADYINALVEEYAWYGEELTFDDFMNAGYIFQGSTVCEDWYIEPGDVHYWVAAMVDENLNVLSATVMSDKVESDSEGLELVESVSSAEGNTTAELYSYLGSELVFKFMYSEDDYEDFSNYYYEINSPADYSVYDWTDKEIADAMAIGTQDTLEYYMSLPENAPYFGDDWWENLSQILYPAGWIPTLWGGDMLYAEGVDEPVQKVLIASTLENITDEGVVYNVEYAVVRHDFKGSVVPSAAVSSVVKAPKAVKFHNKKAEGLKTNGAAKVHFVSTGLSLVK